jgi:hypothetical protein
MILVAVAVPVFLLAINYSIKRIQLSHQSGTRVSAAFAAGAAALKKYNPAKKWSSQKERVYTATAQALCDRAFDLKKENLMTASVISVKRATKNYSHCKPTKIYGALSNLGLTTILSGNAKTNFDTLTGLDAQLIIKNPLLCDDAPLDAVVFNPDETLSFDFYSTQEENEPGSDKDKSTQEESEPGSDKDKSAQEENEPGLDKDKSTQEETHSIVRYEENTEKLALTLDVGQKCIRCDCKCIGKIVNAYPAQCDVDIILTLPTNHAACTSNNSNSSPLIPPNGTASSPIAEIAAGYTTFLNHFLHTVGVAVGVVPYSGKISIPPNRVNWTIAIPPLDKIPNPPYLKQAVAYGTDGQMGGDVVDSNILYEWGDSEYGSPIMFRKGYGAYQNTNDIYSLYRGVKYHCGVYREITPPLTLISTDSPDTHANNDFKFQRMNLNPCYLGHCNLLGGICEKDCPAYVANPYFITELTDNLQSVVHDLSLIRPINDPKNKSNFLFLAAQWAQNLLSDWTAHPASPQNAEKFAHPDRSKKKQAIILLVNAPDHFEPQELTYLGFDNDASEVPMFESEAIDFGYNYGAPTNNALTSPVEGTKGILKFSVVSGSAAYNSNNGYYECTATGRLSFPEKHLLKLVVEPGNAPSVTFYGDNGVEGNLGTHSLTGPRTFIFSGAPNPTFANYIDKSIWTSGYNSTNGVNFGHNLSKYKVGYLLNSAVIINCILRNQIIRHYMGNYGNNNTGIKPLITNTGVLGVKHRTEEDMCRLFQEIQPIQRKSLCRTPTEIHASPIIPLDTDIIVVITEWF